MTLHTNHGAKVELVTAREVTVWIASGRGRIDWHYKAPKPRKGIEIEERPIWHVTAKLASPYHDGSGKVGDMVRDGREFPASDLRASQGWGEILDACEATERKRGSKTDATLSLGLLGPLP